MARLRYEVQRRLSGRRNNTRTLESQLNPEAKLELSQQRRASLVPAETLYSTHWSESRHRVYQHYSETRILVTKGQQNLLLINLESYAVLRQEGMQLIHLGLVMIHIHALHRRNAGTNALIVLRDTRWNDDKSIIGTMEDDLSEGLQQNYKELGGYCSLLWNLKSEIHKLLSRVNEKDIEDINEEEFVTPCFSEYLEIWDTLGEPSGRFSPSRSPFAKIKPIAGLLTASVLSSASRYSFEVEEVGRFIQTVSLYHVLLPEFVSFAFGVPSKGVLLAL
ncbi:hypothetical protein ZIOFF_033919 [Zingiber officinale]|uniref:Uncharacterized protein n=1 Tax=Zingiber officinale TaxID=94328 RepID=A0A8J5GRF8_ZINOF|nr:hypothetical protein ZIOFF_033919 [Zingiber officinale]